MWPSSKICVMGGEQAADVLASVKAKQLGTTLEAMTEAERTKIRQPILDRYEAESSATYATSRLWDDGILDIADTRSALGLAIAMSLNAPIPEHRFGVFRM
jgi:3-methylcrotonyl-CoA carboxylase beta subunit